MTLCVCVTDTPECLHSVEDCEGKPVGKTNYPKCGTCNRFIRCRKKAKEILCPSERPVFDVSGKCKPKATAVCRGYVSVQVRQERRKVEEKGGGGGRGGGGRGGGVRGVVNLGV